MPKRTICIVCTFVILIMNMSSTFAQQDAVKTLEKVVESFTAALQKPELETLDKLAAAELTYGHSSGKIESKAEFISTLTSGASVFDKITISQQKTQVLDNTAIVRQVMLANTNDPGKGPAVIKLGIILTWVKQDGHWQLLARQAYKLP